MPQIKWAFRAPGQSDEKRHLKTSCKFLNSQGEKRKKNTQKKSRIQGKQKGKGTKSGSSSTAVEAGKAATNH